jgi:hypothetical protein
MSKPYATLPPRTTNPYNFSSTVACLTKSKPLLHIHSHSIDDASDGQLIITDTLGAVEFPNPNVNRGSSDFDVRHSFRGAVTYSVPSWNANLFSKAVTGGWSLDSIGIAQSGLPVDLIGGFGLNFRGTVKPDVVPGQSFYL